MKTNESIDWRELNEKEKSYAVRIINWFHFRKTNRSWLKEETITWELIRLLQIIPSEYLLRNFLIKIKEKNPSINKIINSITDELNTVKIEPYPSLGLEGIKKKSRSDIGIETINFRLWIEVKTQIDGKLNGQIKKQMTSPSFKKDKNGAIVALIPENQDYGQEKITWNDVFNVIEESYKSIKNQNNKTLRGYELMLEEMISRIKLRNFYKK